MRFLKWPALYAMYVEVSGASQYDVQRQLATVKTATMQMIALMGDVLGELTTAASMF